MNAYILLGMLISIIFLVVYVLIIRPFLRVLHPLKTQQLSGNFFIIKSGITNVYVYETTSQQLICFDTGFSTSTKLKLEFSKLNLDPSKVSHIFFTHLDPDHVAGLELFDESTTLYLHELELQKGEFKTRIFRSFKSLPKTDKSVQYVYDGQNITIDNVTIQIIGLPGHTPGSIGFFINECILIVGDAMGVSKRGNISTLPSFINDNNREANRSLERIKNYKKQLEMLCTAHSGVLDATEFSSS